MSENGKRSSEFVWTVQENTQKYLRELRDVNSMLLRKVEVLEADKNILKGRLTNVTANLSQEREERRNLIVRIGAMESLREAAIAEYRHVETQNNSLACLYAATYGLHGTLDLEELLGVIKEIVANLIGSEEMGILEIDSDGKIQVLDRMGLDLEDLQEIASQSGVIHNTIESGLLYLRNQEDSEVDSNSRESELTACIPLKVQSQTIGAIAVFRLLPQKRTLESIDYEIIDLLGRQAGIAIHSARLQSLFMSSKSD